MSVQLVGIGVTLPSVDVSLTPTTLQMPWSGESLLLGISIPDSSGVGVIPSLDFSDPDNSQYLPLLAGFG